jgi:3-oxoacyl-[acyl-carrier-protein] synthase III
MQNTVRVGVQTVQELMDRAARPIGSVDVLACVQPRRWVPTAIAEGLGLDPARAPQTFDDYAHLGAVGVITNLVAARDAGRLRRDATVALYAQGAGFTRSAALLRW